MKTFVTVVQESSFAKAASKLSISSPAVSKQISLLEQELGMQLLARSTRALSLTEAGASYYEQAKKVIKEFDELATIVNEGHKEPAGTLKVAAAVHFAKAQLIPHLSKFLSLYPKISLTLELMERFPDMESEGIDIVIGMSRPVSELCIQKTVGYTHYVLSASPAYLNEFGIPKRPQDLKKHRYIDHSLRVPVHITRFKGGKEVHFEPYLLVNDTGAMKELALQGLGIVKLHAYMVEEELNSGKLVEVLKDFREEKQPILVNFMPYKHLPPKIRSFLDFFCP